MIIVTLSNSICAQQGQRVQLFETGTIYNPDIARTNITQYEVSHTSRLLCVFAANSPAQMSLQEKKGHRSHQTHVSSTNNTSL